MHLAYQDQHFACENPSILLYVVTVFCFLCHIVLSVREGCLEIVSTLEQLGTVPLRTLSYILFGKCVCAFLWVHP